MHYYSQNICTYQKARSIMRRQEGAGRIGRLTVQARSRVGAMATWLKILLILCILGILGFVGLGFAGYTIFKQATDSTAVQKIADAIVTLDGPLPSKYVYTFGFGVAGTNVAAINNNTDKLVYILATETKNGGNKTPEQLIDAIKEGGTMPTPGGSSNSAKKIKVENVGNLDIGSAKMPYALGTTESAAGKTSEQFIGVVKSPSNGLTYLIVQSTDPENHLSLEKVTEFTGHITAFK